MVIIIYIYSLIIEDNITFIIIEGYLIFQIRNTGTHANNLLYNIIKMA